MTEGVAAWMGIAAIARLALAIACCPPSQVLTLPLCGDGSHRIAIPLDRKKAPREESPTGCHAVCSRKLATDSEDCPDC
ncbi:hypothetical protein [Sphingomonas sp.]|uniref:hypothetical protein n=1 Tax=Sphingomonas sp. TaxID=28214 RepID=UPI0025EA9D5A|nr:hypothetical protein [Sphingomonas sp.]